MQEKEHDVAGGDGDVRPGSMVRRHPGGVPAIRRIHVRCSPKSNETFSPPPVNP